MSSTYAMPWAAAAQASATPQMSARGIRAAPVAIARSRSEAAGAFPCQATPHIVVRSISATRLQASSIRSSCDKSGLDTSASFSGHSTVTAQPLASARPGSYVPPCQQTGSWVQPVRQSSYVPPPLSAQASYVRPPGSYVPPSGSYVPANGSYVPPSPQASYVPAVGKAYVARPSTGSTGSDSYVASASLSHGSYTPAVVATGSYVPPAQVLTYQPQQASTPAAPVRFFSCGPVAAVASQSTLAGSFEGREVHVGEALAAGLQVVVGPHRFNCSHLLGRGSFSKVFAAETVSGGSPSHRGGQPQDAALKDIRCGSKGELDTALFEANLLERLGRCLLQPADPLGAGSMLRVPTYLAHRVDECDDDGWQVRIAMSRTPGEPLDEFLSKSIFPTSDAADAIRRGCAMAAELIRQLGPTLHRVSAFAFHRDVNPRNILVGDARTGGTLVPGREAESSAKRASFWLIDFGLAVDAASWPSKWTTSDVAGDCRYWGASSFLMSFYGSKDLLARPGFCHQYLTRLDVVGLGLSALEVMCSIALSNHENAQLKGSWGRLFQTWQQQKQEVSDWHQQMFDVFAARGDIGPLYRRLVQEQAVERVMEHHRQLRQLLRSCTRRAEDAHIQDLLAVLAELLDESSSLSLLDAVHRLSQGGAPRDEPTWSAPVVHPLQTLPAAAIRSASSLGAAPQSQRDEEHSASPRLFRGCMARPCPARPVRGCGGSSSRECLAPVLVQPLPLGAPVRSTSVQRQLKGDVAAPAAQSRVVRARFAGA
eukprot:TRINITY_DN18779_c0_g3_i1.p1 TRINITY_DN18779_c0_g3~~TRINITY_DN18779_c0_g3_i1.p1  ORF type:complete len:767 (+),score=125.27 TRINITY_DN18779_c0_g3_i1:62-2362(+)